MANFYTDSPELKHYLNHPLMKRIVELRERDFAEKDQYPSDSINRVVERQFVLVSFFFES